MPLFDLPALSLQARDSFKEFTSLQPFNCDTWSCPWLEAQLSLHTRQPRGLLLMQDWGLADQEECLETTTQILSDLLTSGDATGNNYDSTQRRLFHPRRKWAQQIRAGDWWISNAVWALRKTGGKTGELADAIHKKAFPLWLEVVYHLAKDNADFHLVVAGAWARRTRPVQTPEDLTTYLKQRATWANQNARNKTELSETQLNRIEACRGRVWYVKHPCIWSYRGLEGSPPPEETIPAVERN